MGAPLSTRKGGWSVSYDAAGRIATKTETPWGPGAPKLWAYTYDTAGRLATSELDGGGPVAYAYDANGNRAGATVDAQDRVTSQGGVTYTYDAHGNVTTRTVAGATQTLAWDSEGGLLSVTKPGAPTVDYALDARGRRVAKRVDGAVVREWLYDGQLRVVGEAVRGAGGVVTHTRAYGYVPERHLPVLMVDTAGGVSTTYRIYGDHLGSLRSVVDVATGAAVQTMEHGPWGEVLAESVTAGFEGVPFGFAGGLYDDATGLVRFGAREYDPSTGRWLTKDEARFGGGWNFYEYARGDPVNWVDPTGRWSWPWDDPPAGGGGSSGGGGASGTYESPHHAPCLEPAQKKCRLDKGEFKKGPDGKDVTVCTYACADGTPCAKTYEGLVNCLDPGDCGTPN